jgi:hypothetical protein
MRYDFNASQLVQNPPPAISHLADRTSSTKPRVTRHILPTRHLDPKKKNSSRQSQSNHLTSSHIVPLASTNPAQFGDGDVSMTDETDHKSDDSDAVSDLLFAWLYNDVYDKIIVDYFPKYTDADIRSMLQVALDVIKLSPGDRARHISGEQPFNHYGSLSSGS